MWKKILQDSELKKHIKTYIQDVKDNKENIRSRLVAATLEPVFFFILVAIAFEGSIRMWLNREYMGTSEEVNEYMRKHGKPLYFEHMKNRKTNTQQALENMRWKEPGSEMPTKIKNAAIDYQDPASAEARGIFELYSGDMAMLLYIGVAVLICIVRGIICTIRYDIILEALWKAIKTNHWEAFLNTPWLSDVAKSEITEIIEYTKRVKDRFSEIKGTEPSKVLPRCNFDEYLFKKELRTRFIRVLYSILKAKNVYKYNCIRNIRVIKYTNQTRQITHMANLEFGWTIIPCLLLLCVSVPSFSLALALDEVYKPASWIKIVGNQWFWTYEFSAFDEQVEMQSVIASSEDLTQNALRLFITDNTVVMPYNQYTRLLVSSVDVIHSWTIPAMGVKIDACPGRINSVTVLPTRTGVYYGQCSEICGVNHGFMPIVVEVI